MKLISPQLQAFLAVVNFKTVQAAATELHLTQTAITQRIKTLESSLSTCLFIRSRQGMQLTAEGKSLFKYCQQVQLLEGEVLSQLTNPQDKLIYLCVSGPATIMQTRIIPVCLNLLPRYPNLTFQFDIQDNETRVRSLQQGHAHLAIIEKQFITAEFKHKNLAPEEYLLVASIKWDQRSMIDIIKNEAIIDFDAQDQITFDYLKHYSLFQYANNKRHFVNRSDVLAGLIAQGIGYGVLPKDIATPLIVSQQLIILNEAKVFPYEYSLAWYPRPQANGYFQEIIHACK